ncbi:tetratricopeptide repeat protein [Loktanella sp. Alg231-35]|uniref:tetratricopeptide repeat protein n=1 Tax=Loktanella sp. Alg231-35 TaxID=1922220 RepID=UPI000D5546C4|nr:tetratricopeptide repeat protein [Loktanella sp. Alg231-35]
MQKLLCLCGLVLGLGLTGAPALSQSNLADLQAGAEASLVAGEPTQTAALAEQMLAQDPDSYPALFLLAVAQSELGQDAASAKTAARAYDVAPDEQSRLQAARLVARGRGRLNQFVRAEFWLRRAANNISSEEDAQAVVTEYVRITAANPLSVQLNGSIAPSDNVNNGSDDGILEFEGIPLTFLLPEDRRALSGVEYFGSVQLAYRLSEDETQRTSLNAAMSGQAYTLSSEARGLLDSSPNADIRSVTGNDFSTFLAQIGASHTRKTLSPLGPVTFGFNLGSYWSGGNRIVDFSDLIVSHTIPVNNRAFYSIRGSVRDQNVLTDALVDTLTYDLSGSFSSALPNNDKIQLTLTSRKNEAGPESSYTEYSSEVSYEFAQPVLGTRWSSSLELGYRNYRVFTTTLDGRRDHFVTIGANTVFEDIRYFGFSPSLDVSATRTSSNAEEVESSALQIRFGIVSNF